tara:strand:- start:187 stop:516 length:330 start_codon:yes stop_codon:yes gene_type:complete
MPQNKQHKARQLATSVRALTRPIYRKRGFAEANILNDWESIVGTDLAKVTIPQLLTNHGTLKIRVSGPQATELSHMETQILDRVATYYGYRAAKKLSFVQGPINSDNKK